MATIDPANSETDCLSGLGILAPNREWIEGDQLHRFRCKLISGGHNEQANRIKQILREAFWKMCDQGLITTDDISSQ